MADNVDAQPRRRRYPWRRRQYWLFAGLCLVGLILALPFFLGVRAQTKLARELDKIRAAGEPVTSVELAQYAHATPEALEASKAYTKAFDAASKNVDRDVVFAFEEAIKTPSLHGRFPETLLDLMRKRLAMDSEKLALLHQAIQGPPARFPIDYSQGIDAEMPHLVYLPKLIELLQWESFLAAHDGHMDQAVQRVSEILHVADSIREEPTVYSQVRRTGFQRTAITTLQRLLEIGALSDAQLRDLEKAFRASETPEAYTRALIGERSLFLIYCGIDARSGIRKSTNRPKGEEIIHSTILRAYARNDLLDFCTITKHQIEASRIPYPERRAAASAVKKELDEHLKSLISFLWYSSPCAWDDGGRSFACGEAALYTAYAALAVERCRHRNGAPPAELGDLVPEFLDAVPEDPFDGQPLRYKPFENGYVVYSIGENGADDGGDDTSQPKKSAPDICFRVER